MDKIHWKSTCKSVNEKSIKTKDGGIENNQDDHKRSKLPFCLFELRNNHYIVLQMCLLLVATHQRRQYSTQQFCHGRGKDLVPKRKW